MWYQVESRKKPMIFITAIFIEFVTLAVLNFIAL